VFQFDQGIYKMLKKTVFIAAAIVLLHLAGNIQAAGNVQRGADLSYDCVNCHGSDGKGNFETPPIAGLDEAYILEQLDGFCIGEKASLDGMMTTYTEDRTEQERKDLAAFWASQEK